METKNREKVLIVDDDPSMGVLLRELLEKRNYAPLTATHPKEALELFRQEAPTLAFLDINMPDMNGLELAKQMLKLNPSVELVFVTGFGTFDNAIEAIKIGAYDYLRKPFNLAEFEICLKRHEDRLELQEKVRKAQRRYHDLVQNIPALIFVLSANLELQFINNACSRILDITPDEAMSRPAWFMETIHPDDRKQVEKMLMESCATHDRAHSIECRMFHGKGYAIHVLLRTIPGDSPAHAGMQEPVIEAVAVDITDRVMLEKAMVQKERLELLGTVTSEVAHEVRNPLMSIGGFAKRLQHRHPELSEPEIILRECSRLENLVNRIRDYLEPIEIKPGECFVNSLISHALDVIRENLETKDITVECDLAPDIKPVFMDKDILTQVFLNLLQNAASGIGQDKIICMKSYQTGSSINVDIKSSILNPKMRDPEQVFLPFGEEAHIMGLPLTYRLVRNMGGVLSFSQRDREITFTVTLPVKN